MEYYKNQTWIKYVCCVYPTEAGWLLSAGSLAVKVCLRKRYSRVGWFVALTEAHTLKHRPWPHCHSFTVTLTNRVASFLSRGLQMWVKGGDVLQKNKRIPHESQLSDMEAHLCRNIHLFFLMRILWVHFILNIEVKWDRWTTAVKDLH